MNKIIIVALSFTLILIGCKSTYEPSYVGDITEVKSVLVTFFHVL